MEPETFHTDKISPACGQVSFAVGDGGGHDQVDPRTSEDPYMHLSCSAADILRRQTLTSTAKVGVTTLYRFATKEDLIILCISTICAVAGGAALPLMTIVFGNISGLFKDFFNEALSGDDLRATLGQKVLYFVYLAVGEFVTVYISTVGHIYAGERITTQIRKHYLAACLRQNVGFHDELGAGAITTRITSDTNLIQDGISEKVGLTTAAVATFAAALIISFVKFWKLSIILSSTILAMVFIMALTSKFRVAYIRKSLESYSQAGNVAEEALSSIRSATAFGSQEWLAMRYERCITQAGYYSFRAKVMLGCMLGGFFVVVYLIYGLAFWQGTHFLVDGETHLSDILTIVLSIMNAAFALGNVAPNLQAFTTAISAATRIFDVIDRESPLDPCSGTGLVAGPLKKPVDIDFRHVKHIYPSRPGMVVLDNLSLHFPAGKKTAIVGGSGSGKSTIIALLERFYEPVAGEIYFGQHEIKSLSLQSLRQHTSLVSQEPTLFATTIFENIRYGLAGSRFQHASEQDQRERVIQAAKMANAHNFIMNLFDEYETNVGERGFLLSGGQRQRVAIARAIVGDPKVLLLDEATSALDTESERLVQTALEAASEGRTTIIVAHRLSTVMSADNIVVMENGRIIEQGTHVDLLDNKGAYSRLVEGQRLEQLNEASPPIWDPYSIMEAKKEFERAVYRAFSTNSLTWSDSSQSEYAVADSLLRFAPSKALLQSPHQNQPSNRYGKSTGYSLWALLKMILAFNRPDWIWMVAGLAWSIICGLGNPTQAVLFAAQILTLAKFPYFSSLQETVHRSSFYSLMYLMLAFVQLIAFIAQGACFALCSERLIHRARDQAFRAMLRQDVAFFDGDANTSGALTSFLSTETTHIAGLSGATLGAMLTVITTLVSSLALSLAIGWKLAIVSASTIPLLLACGFLRFWILSDYEHRIQKVYQRSASYACEATNAIRTVASLGREQNVIDQYEAALNEQLWKSLQSVLKSSTLYAASQSIIFLCMGLGFWYGGTLIAQGEYSMLQFFVCFPAITFGAQSAGTLFSFAPDMGKAREAACQLKRLLDRQPDIDTLSSDGWSLARQDVEGSVTLQDVHFSYPTRHSEPVLRGLTLDIRPGQYVAFVGASGCGKSTAIALLQRFYDPDSGSIRLDGKDISGLNVNEYRSCLSLVSQEPSIYSGTVFDNILFGLVEQEISHSDIVSVCKEANIYDFIMSLPDGFSTMIGSKGNTLSGGQKQRIAIARALLRKPKVLLLDEATSALDSESERIVQEALDKAAKGRTTIAVAHRLSTVQNADLICVFDQGRIVERGTHTELMERGGRYAGLVKQQSLGTS